MLKYIQKSKNYLFPIGLMFSISKKASNIDEEIESINYEQLLVGKEWFVHSGWFNSQEFVLVSSLQNDTNSFDSFIFGDKNVVTHKTKKGPNEEKLHLEKASYKVEGSILSLSVSGIISVEYYEKKGSERVLVNKPKKKVLYDLDWSIIEINDKRLRLHKANTLVSKELSVN